MFRLTAISCILFLACGTAFAQSGPRKILFVIGGSNTAGFLEGDNTEERDEHRAEIDNFSTTSGNHGWGELAVELEAAGYELVQIAEGQGTQSGNFHVGSPLPLETMDLGDYAAIVMGSNNAVYTSGQVDTMETYVRGGGGVIFISDANFGGNWQDASNSDQQFLDRFGLVMNQDRGTYAGTRASGHFLVPGHPLVANGVDEIHGEGVTPVSLGTPVPGVRSEIIVRVPGSEDVRINTPPFNSAGQGGSRDSTAADGVVSTALAGSGRVVGHFDRNTFFNTRGAGSNITRFDNRQYALNLFAWVSAGKDLPVPSNGWEAWRRKRFNEIDRNNPALSGDLGDPDNDGLPNWREALHGLNPHTADGGGPLSYFSEVSATQVRWRFRQGGTWDNTSLRLARSIDLEDWSESIPDSIEMLESVSGGRWLEHVIATGGGNGFLRFEFDPAAVAP